MTSRHAYGLLVAALLAVPTVAHAGRTKSTAPSRNVSHAPAPETRRLDEIHIEGEIAVPQVLFITARDQRRFMESHHRRYLRTSLEVGRRTVAPTRIVLVDAVPADARKEIQP